MSIFLISEDGGQFFVVLCSYSDSVKNLIITNNDDINIKKVKIVIYFSKTLPIYLNFHLY